MQFIMYHDHQYYRAKIITVIIFTLFYIFQSSAYDLFFSNSTRKKTQEKNRLLKAEPLYTNVANTLYFI